MTESQIEKIQEYLSGEMNSEEQKAFQRELNTDKDFLTAFNTYRAIEAHMRDTKEYTSEAALKISLSKLGTEFFNTEPEISTGNSKKEEYIVKKSTFSHISTKKSFRLGNIPIWQIAAAILSGIVIVGMLYILSNKETAKEQVAIIPATSHDSAGSPKNSADTGLQTPISPNLAKQDTGSNTRPNIKPSDLNNEQLFTKYFKPDAAPKDREGPLEDAFDQYEKGQFASAATTFESADLNASTRGEATDTILTKFYASYYKALSYIAIKKDAKAVQLLKDVTGPTPILQAKVRWYLALAYLRTGDLLKAISLLRAIDQNSEAGAYRLKADKLMIELKKRGQ